MTAATQSDLQVVARALALELARVDPGRRVLDDVDRQRNDQAAYVARLAVRARQPHLDAGEALADLLGLVVRNNPGASFVEILQRSDIQAALAEHLGLAQAEVAQRVSSVRETMSKRGHAAAARELRALGLPDPPAPTVGVASSFAAQALGDLDRSHSEGLGRLTARAAAGFDAVTPKASYVEAEGGVTNVRAALARDRERAVRDAVRATTRDLSNRSAIAAQVVAARSYQEAKLDAYVAAVPAGTVVLKLWVANFAKPSPVCPTCVALHGTVVAMDSAFDESQSFSPGKPPKAYGGLLLPPRHPWCACTVIPYVPGTPGLDPVAMREFARGYAHEAKGMAPRSFPLDDVSDLARTTASMASSDIRGLSDAQYELAVDAFRACVVRRLGE